MSGAQFPEKENKLFSKMHGRKRIVIKIILIVDKKKITTSHTAVGRQDLEKNRCARILCVKYESSFSRTQF